MRIPPLLERLESEHPGVLAYYRAIADHFQVPYTRCALAVERGLEKHGYGAAAAACLDLERIGVLPVPRVTSDAQVGALWGNLIFEIALREVLEFYPPANVDIRDWLPPPLSGYADIPERRRLAESEARYWARALLMTAPELYLFPFLRDASANNLLGVDLAAGWGRVCLALRDFSALHVLACDFGAGSLKQLRRFADRAGIHGRVSCVRSGVTALPLADARADFFLAFDIFEHLSDGSNQLCLKEMLRCARDGAILYAEIPLHDYCPAITHIQDFSYDSVVALFHGVRACGRGFRLRHHVPEVPAHFTFEIVSDQRR